MNACANCGHEKASHAIDVDGYAGMCMHGERWDFCECGRFTPMITVIGKLADTQQYVGRRREGFCVLASRSDWSEEMQAEFIAEAMRDGRPLLFASWQATGKYRNELVQILKHLIDNPGA